ncbi:MAG: hypothetical protein WAX77_10690 [Methylococcaceae bacterium]
MGLLIVALGLNACEQSSPSIKQEITKKYTQETQLEGAVSNNHAPIKTGTVQVSSLSNKTIAQTTLSGSNHYQITIPANTELPLILNFYPSADDKDNTQALMAVVIHPSVTHYDISPLTTTIAKNAERLGGYSHTNMVRAAEDTVHVPDANKTSTGFRGDPTTQYGGWH